METRIRFLAFGFTAILVTLASGPAYSIPLSCDELCTFQSSCNEPCTWFGTTTCGAYGVSASCDPPPPTCNTINGTNGGDTLYGTSNADCIYGFNGADTLYGDAGPDQLWR